MLAWAGEHDLPVATVGLGSNLLVADEGFDGLVLKLGGELAEARVEGERLLAGGGAANAVCLHRARAAGLGGFEFACAIPGTIGGGVWMNAGAYGSDWAAILDRALVVDRAGRPLADAGGARPQLPALGAPPRPGRRARRVRAGAAARGADQGERRRAAGAAQGGAADEQAHLRQRLQEPRARAQRRADARGLRAEGAPDRRRADLAEARELHRERGRRTVRRRGRADGRGPAAGAASSSESSSCTRSSSSARSSCRRCGRSGARRGESRDVPRPSSQRPRARAAVVHLPRARAPAVLRVAPVRPLVARRLRDRARRGRRSTCSRARRRCSPSRRSRSRARRRPSPRMCATALAPIAGPEPARAEQRRSRAAAGEAPRRGRRQVRPRLPAHPARDRSARASALPSRAGARRPGWLPPAPA